MNPKLFAAVVLLSLTSTGLIVGSAEPGTPQTIVVRFFDKSFLPNSSTFLGFPITQTYTKMIALQPANPDEFLALALQAPGVETAFADAIDYEAKPLSPVAATVNDAAYTIHANAMPALASMRIPETWSTTKAVPNAAVCVIDTGLYDHEDLGGFISGFNSMTSVADPQAAPTPGGDREDHGTYVAGVSSAVTDNAQGVAGVNGLGFYAVRWTNDDGNPSTASKVDAIDWCADNANTMPLTVINISWHISCPMAVLDALEDAWNAGRVIVASGGNGDPDGDGITCPANDSHVIAAVCFDAAFGQCFEGADAYAAGPEAEVAARCPDILGTPYDPVTDTSEYRSSCGTSTSAPIISGAIALVWGYYDSIGLTLNNGQIRDRVRNTTNHVVVGLGLPGPPLTTPDNVFGFGALDAKCFMDGNLGCQLAANDDFSDAESISLGSITSGFNWDATEETGEIFPCGSMSSVWYTFTAPVSPSSGNILIKPEPPADPFYDYTLALYEDGPGGTISDLIPMTCSSGVPLDDNVVAGQTYYVQVAGTDQDGHEQETGRFDLSVDYSLHPSFTVEPNPPCVGSWFTLTDTSTTGAHPLNQHHWTLETPSGTFTYGWEPWTVSHTLWLDSPGLIVTLNVTDTNGNWRRTEPIDIGLENCHQTWAAGDEIGGELLVVGNDPGCKTGPPDSFDARPNDIAQSFGLGGGPITGHEPFPGGISLPGASALSGRLYVAGGAKDCNFNPTSSTWVYGGGWSSGSSLNIRRIDPAAATVGGTLYWAGGDKTGGDPTNEASTHVPTPALEKSTGGSWTRMQNMPAGLIGSSALANGNQLVVAGGYGHPQQTNRFIQIYETASGTWLGNHLPQERTAFGSASCGDAERIVVGGMVGEDVPMYAFYDSGAQNTVLRHTPGGWLSTPSLPAKTAFAQVADLGPWTFVQGGFTAPSAGASITASSQVVRLNCPATSLPSLPMAPVLTETIADGEMQAGPCAPSTATFIAQPIADPCLLLFIFGGTNKAVQKGSIYEPGCPSDHIYIMEPVDGNVIDLTEAAATLGMSKKLLLPVASMGSARLDDGRIVIVGGRTSGLDEKGQPSCYIPTKVVQIFDPVTLTVTPGPLLPKGLIAPAVTVIGNTVYVAGGDDRGDFPVINFPVPSAATDDRPRHPSATRYSHNFAGGGGWSTGSDLPLAVVHGGLSFVSGRDVWLIGGTHHPLSSVRAVQENIAGEGNGAIPVLPWALAHHNAEACASSGGWSGWIFTRGITKGTVYHTETGTTTWAPDSLHYSSGLWSPVFGPPVAFSVGWGPTFTDTDTGTFPGVQRSLASIPMCPP